MNKYLAIFGTSFRQESKTLGNSFVSVFGFGLIIFIFSQMWIYIYTYGGGNVIEGYSLNMMIWYLVMSEIIVFTVKPRAIVRAYSDDIKSGRIAYQMNKPYNYYLYQTSSQMGAFSLKFLFILVSGIVFGLIFAGPITTFDVIGLLPLMVSLALSMVLTCVLYGAIGLLSFWVEDATPLSWIVQRLTLTLGVLFPPQVFPGIVQDIITYSPIYALVGGPAQLLVNFSWELFLKVVIIQILYIIVFAGISALLYNSGRKKVNINGG